MWRLAILISEPTERAVTRSPPFSAACPKLPNAAPDGSPAAAHSGFAGRKGHWRDDFSDGRLDGILVAERIPLSVRTLAEAEGVEAYEIGWPMKLTRVA